ncbi:transcriptional regulator [Streptomyces sp. NRRL F-5755]|uniref:response regulator transcription factor n=1 Tax=Streptomyces sp. NRRL F-5755 TaxID=1519475 RepID=UPI0006AFF8EE|nr:response regulator transcription factor [Streptomyces sp. NRRL F-5755]KOT93222.1 transcriptional regulator [Streptomyces sp. NRRL F-5755]
MNVLVVEDDPQIAAVIRRGLEAEGYTVEHAADGPTGLRLGLKHPFRAIVLDIMLPGIHGYRVCAELRAAGVNTPVLMLTAKDGEYDEAEGLDIGADDYLRKPFSYVVLLARLRALIRRGGSTGDGVLRAGDLWLDTAGRRCGRGEQEIALTGQEFAVLRCLIRAPGQVLSKAEILDDAWDMAYNGAPSIVEVYISMLRRKIDHPFGQHSIETVRGAGYRLVADGA